jgi:hypothetical protein
MKNLFQNVCLSFLALFFLASCQGLEDAQAPVMEDAQAPVMDDSMSQSNSDINARKGRIMEFATFVIGNEEVTPVNSQGAGAAFFSLNPDGSTLNFQIRVANTTGVFAAHLHQAPAGANGPVVVTLLMQDPSGLVNGVLAEGMITNENLVGPLLDMEIMDLIKEIQNGNIYVNIHTSVNPSGELRGQVSEIKPEFNNNFNVKLSGLNEVPSVISDAVGVAKFRFNSDNSALNFQINVDNISDIKFSHIHLAKPGMNGPVVITLNSEKMNGPVEGVYAKGTLTMASLVGKLMGGDLMILKEAMRSKYAYVNVHTDQVPSGELRGNF